MSDLGAATNHGVRNRDQGFAVGGAEHGAARFDVTTIGEPLIRLSVPIGDRLADATRLAVHVGCAEANVCAAMAGLGRRTGWIAKVPANALGRLVVNRARAWGVDVESFVTAEEGRIGTYYAELATPPLASKVVYDRTGSAFCELRADEVDWDYLLDTQILHLTGITPALGPGPRQLVLEAQRRARRNGVRVSLDINYRSSLWSVEEAGTTLRAMAREVDILFCGRRDARTIFGLATSGEDLLHEVVASTSADVVVLTLGSEGAIAAVQGRVLRQPAIPVTVVDRIGAGDAFAAGFLDGVLDEDPARGLMLGAGLAALALSHTGDAVTATRDEVASLLQASEGAVAR